MKIIATKRGRCHTLRWLEQFCGLSRNEAKMLKKGRTLNVKREHGDAIVDRGVAVKVEPVKPEIVTDAPVDVETQVITGDDIVTEELTNEDGDDEPEGEVL